jgi:hypothetical protein
VLYWTKNLFRAGGVVLDEKATTWKNGVQKQNTLSELRLSALFHLDISSATKDINMEALLSERSSYVTLQTS